MLYPPRAPSTTELEGRNFATRRVLWRLRSGCDRVHACVAEAADPRPRVRRISRIGSARRRAVAPGAPRHAPRESHGDRLRRSSDIVGWPACSRPCGRFEERAPIGTDARRTSWACWPAAGTRLSWFFHEAFRPDARFDYAVGASHQRRRRVRELRHTSISGGSAMRCSRAPAAARTCDGTVAAGHRQVRRRHGIASGGTAAMRSDGSIYKSRRGPCWPASIRRRCCCSTPTGATTPAPDPPLPAVGARLACTGWCGCRTRCSRVRPW